MHSLTSHCNFCKKQFVRSREWQQYCSSECRRRYWIRWRRTPAGVRYLKARAKYMRRYRKKHPDSDISYLKQQNRYYQSKYGISVQDKKKMYLKQKGLCGLCGKPLPLSYHKAHLDHNHATGKLRMLLHSDCNRKLAIFEDREFALRAELYLRLCKHLKGA